jgi:dipeptidyl-peptidase 4
MIKKLFFSLVTLTLAFAALAQPRWTADGNGYYKMEDGELVQYVLPSASKSTLVSKSDLTPKGTSQPLSVNNFMFSADQQQILFYTNSRRVWRYETRGDYWIYNRTLKTLTQIGKNRPEATLMFAKFSPDGKKVAYVSEQNLYVADVATQKEIALTTDGNRKLINGTFDWVYEEEFSCRDGFDWSPDSQHLSFWQIDASKIRDYYMINTTDSVYSRIIPVEYPTVGEKPSPARLGIINVDTRKTHWLSIPGQADDNYLVRTEWRSPTEIFVQQMNRAQNTNIIYSYQTTTSKATVVYQESDPAWIEVFSFNGNPSSYGYRHNFQWLNDKREFLWQSEKDGWNHLYRVGINGKETLITPGNYDVIEYISLNEKTNTIYFLASPENATQRYLYKTRLDGKGKAERITPLNQPGTHDYTISPTGKWAQHSFSNHYTRPMEEWIDISTHQAIRESESIAGRLTKTPLKPAVEFFKVKTEEGIEMDGWVVKPKNFDPSRKYPVVFMVYTEPASQTVRDVFGAGRNRLYQGDMAGDGYLYVSLDSRGTPAPKGREWRKSIYKKVGILNVRDQAMGAKEILKWPYADADRVAVWGWSGGGTTTLHLLFQYPEIYKTGIAVAAVGNRATYDNIYEERYMGVPDADFTDYKKCSPITYAKNLKGNLLYIHGTGDDNVHYNNAEMLVNELIKHGKQFQMMAYPNRSHGIYEGEGTSAHLAGLFTSYLRKHCPPGPKE